MCGGSYLKDVILIADNSFGCSERLICLWLSMKVLRAE